MAIKIDNTDITTIQWDTDDMKLSELGSGYIWAKPYTLTVNNNSGYVTVTCYRTSALEPTAGTGSSATLANQSTIYHGDYIYAIGTSTSTSRIVTKTASPVAFNGDNIEYITGDETITFTSTACVCGTTQNDSSCSTCLSNGCTTNARGYVCTTCTRSSCDMRASGVVCNCTIVADVPDCKECGMDSLSITPTCDTCGKLEVSTDCLRCGTITTSIVFCKSCGLIDVSV